MQTIFITAASGNIGSLLIPSLLTRDEIRLVLPTSAASKLATYKDKPNVTVLEGPLSDPQWVEEQLLKHAVDTVFLNLWGLDELFTAFNTLDAIQRTPSIKHVVYLSACGDFLGDPEHTIDWMAGHTKIKPPVEKALQHINTFTHTVIGPSLFFENDVQVKGAILHERLWVQPFGAIGASRIAVADLARAVEIAVVDRGAKWNKKKIMMGSLKKYTVCFPSSFEQPEEARSFLTAIYLRAKNVLLFGVQPWASRYLLCPATKIAWTNLKRICERNSVLYGAGIFDL